MKKTLYKILLSASLLCAGVLSSFAADGFIDTLRYTICPGDTIRMNARQTIVYKDTILYDTLAVASPSEDSIRMFIVNVYPKFVKEESRVIEPGTSFEWCDTLISTGGTYERIYKTVHGCDSIYRILVAINYPDETPYHFKEYETVCANQRFDWRGRTELNKQGIGQTTHYFDRYKTQAGQDSIYELILTVHPVLRRTQTFPFCGELRWGDWTILKDTVIHDTLPSVTYSCDSIHTIIFVKGTPFHYHDTATIVPGETLIWRGQTITTDGYYEEKHLNAAGCDSIYSIGVGLKEAVPHTPMHTERAAVCEGDIYPWRNKNYREAGIYVDTLYKSGTKEVDSLYVLELTVNKTYSLSERVTFATFPQFYRGIEITGVGTYYANYTTTTGCDSIYTIHVDLEVLRDEENVTICEGEIFSWRGVIRNIPGQYKEVDKDADGNVIAEHILNLTILPKRETRLTAQICEGGSYTFGDRTLYENGIYTYTYHVDGCDSTVILSLNVIATDTITDVAAYNPDEPYRWARDNKLYDEPGVYYHYSTNAGGCTLTEVLILTENHVDIVDTTAIVCPSELPFVWHTIRASQTGQYQREEKQEDGSYIWYRLNLSVRELKDTTVSFVVCGDANVIYNGKTYTQAGYYDDYLGCDTVVHIHISRHPLAVYETNASLGGEHGYTWTFMRDGLSIDSTFYEPGTYEYESPNAVTGCSDLWRLILTKDETSYHFVEKMTICEGDDFSWHGLNGLSSVPGTNTYLDEHKTRTGQDSIYELILTVTPVKRSMQTRYFCGEIEWNGRTYTESAVVYDTIALSTGCYEIMRTNLELARAYKIVEQWELVQGDSLFWHGQTIWGDGVFYDHYKTIHGCDSTYELHVTSIVAPEHTNMYVEQQSICKGDTLVWRGKDIWAEGRYVDTVKTGLKDSIFILNLAVWPSYKDTIVRHLYTCGQNAFIRYQGQDYYQDTLIRSNLPTIHGCDSLVNVYLHFNTALYLSDTAKIADTQLPYTWTYRLSGETRDTVLTTAGTYFHTEAAEGSCVNREELVLIVYPTYLYEDSITICETQLPYHWLNGPADHVNDDLEHPVGTMKQYEYRYTTVNNTDSIYRLRLTIDPAPTRIERIYFCEGERIKIGDNEYFRIKSDSVYRDTLFKPNTGNECDSIIYYEIYQYPQKKLIETQILHLEDTIVWKGDTITSAGTYNAPDSIDDVTGCQIIQQLRVIGEQRQTATMCILDTPYVWVHPQGNDTLYTEGLWTDTVYDSEGAITEFHTLDLKMKIPVDTLKVLRGCLPQGVTWNDITYLNDTVFRDTLLTCDTLFTIKIQIDTTYIIEVVDTICESALPYILGKQKPDTIWSECVRWPHTDTTACGCDSTVYLTLRIIPSLTKTDSTFICEEEIKLNPVTLGNLVDPWFEYRENGRYSGTWQGKWTGVHYSSDTIVYNCDSSYHHHIIVRPSQKVPFDTTYYLCEGDSVQLFWPKTEWVKRDTVYFDTVPMSYDWTDAHHGISYHRNDYLCDSVVRWTVKFVHPEHKDTTAHIVVGDSIWWGGMWRYQPGVYDSIGPAREKNSDSIPCQLTYTLNLIIDTVYHWRDTIDICAHKNTTLTHTWSDGYVQHFTVGAEDTIWRHYFDSLRTKATPNPHDSVYDLCVSYRIIRDTLLFDTICPGDSLAFDRHWFKINNNTTEIQYLKEPGIYRDTMIAVNGCDSIITLYLAMRDRIPVTHRTVHIPDTLAPFYWLHEWTENGSPKDSTQILSATGEYRFVMPSIHGCDSIDSLSLYIHNTYRIKEDTIIICQSETPYKWQDRNDITKTGDYIFHTLTTDGYDSIRYVYIKVLPVIRNTVHLDTICEGDSLRFGLAKLNQPRFLTESGTYYDTLTSHQYGCDSIIELRLNVYPKYRKHKVVDIADTELPYEWKHIQGGTEIASELLNGAGEYVYRFTTSFGCDSIDSLSLRVHQTYLYHDTVTICADQTPYEWEGIKDIYETGEHIKHLQTHDGYDSTLIRYVIVLPVIKHTLFIDTICEGDSLRFGLSKLNQPRFLTESGTYYDTLTSHQYGCDSIIELRLNVYPKYRKHKVVDIADTELPYEWKHIQGGTEIASELLNGTGEYVYRFTTSFGCDSIDSLSLRVHQTYNIKDDTIDICSNETPYTWHTYTNITETKDYTFYGQTHDGYDSIHTVHINVWPVQYTTLTHAMCEGGTHIFGSKKLQLTEGGIYYDTLTSIHGCDSIVTLKLTVNQPYFNNRTEHIIEGNSVEFFGETYSTSGTYTHYGKTPEGCDSTSILQLVVHPLVDTIVTVCKNDLPYLWVNKWNGQVTPLYGAGLYRNDTTYDADGTQLFYGLQLIVNEPIFDTIRYAMCEGSNYRFNGKTLTQSGVYRDTVTAPNGCDSIRTLILTVNKPYFNNRTEHIIEGNSVEFFGETYSTSGTYTHYGKTPEGCDSTSVLQLIVHPLVDTIVTVCKNDLPYLWVNKWNGQVNPLYAAGIYRNDTTYNAEGTQMFYGLQLIVNEPTFDTIRYAMCEGGSYRFHGETLTQTGVYRDTVTAPNGCDSIRTLILTVNKPYFNNRTEHIIEGNSVEFYGETYSTSGTYTHYGKTPEGCDSTSILQLVVHPLVDTIVTVCKNDLPYLWVNKWNGQVNPLYAAGIYRNDTTYNAEGTQMFYGLQLIVNEPTDTTIFRTICAGEKYDFNGHYLTQAGEYRDTLQNNVGCDSMVILHLNVLPKYYNIIERTIYEGDTVHFQDQVFSTAGVYPVRYTSSFGCDSVIELRLTVNRLFDDSVSICSNELPYLWRGKEILESGLYRDTLTDSEGRPSVIGIKVTVLPTARLEEPILKSICEGSEYKFGNRILTLPGTYYDTLTAANGCDSIVSLVLQVEPRKIQTDYKTIFAGDSVEFYGQWYKESGQYEHKEINALGCEDSHILVVTVLQTFNMDTTAYVCRNDLPYVWHGYEYSGAGDFTLPITWNDTSRVTMTLHLVVNETYYCERNVAICDGDHFLFNGKEYTKNSEFYDTIPSRVGCDSIIKYIVSVHPIYDHTFEKHISDKQPYIFHDRVLTNSGTYEWTGKTTAGCDSIEHLILTVHPSFFKSDTMDLCQSDSLNYPYKWVADDGRLIASITETGVYSDSVLTEYGFDSVHQLVIYVHPSYLIREQYEIGEGEVLKIHGRDISQPAIYYDTLRTIHGCDSIFHVVVNKKRTREFTWTKEICQGEYYDFFGRKLTHTGKYVYTSQYKDSIVTLLLTVNPISITEERIVITDKQVPYIYEGRIYETSGVYADTMLNHLGCDSIHRIVLIVSSRYSEWTPMPLCPGSEIKIDGEVITEAGLYTFLRRSRVTGEMDSIYRVEVYDSPAYDMPTEVRTICDGDTIFIGGKAVTRAGHYDFTLKTVEGCDSLLHLDLSVNPSYQYYTDATIRDFETYTWMGKTYSEEGNYDRSWPTIMDCDSTYTLRLKVIPTQRFITIDTICEGQSITWRGKEYNMSGYYTDTVYRPETFYSAIYTLQLTIMHPTFITHATINDICADDDFFDIAFTYTGAKPTTYSIYFDQLAKDEGFVDIINKPFLGEDRIARAPVPVKTEVVYLDHTTYVKPNKYSMRLVLDNGVCGKSQSDSLVVLVKYPSWIIEQNWNDVVAPLKKDYNGGYEFSQVSWYVNGTLQPNNGLGYMQNSQLKDGDEIVMAATRKGENYAIPTCPLVIAINNNSAYEEPILVYPTKAPRFAARITIEAPQSGEYAIYSSMGASVSHGTFEQGKNEVTLPSVNGIYILRLKQGDKVESRKVIIE